MYFEQIFVIQNFRNMYTLIQGKFKARLVHRCGCFSDILTSIDLNFQTSIYGISVATCDCVYMLRGYFQNNLSVGRILCFYWVTSYDVTLILSTSPQFTCQHLAVLLLWSSAFLRKTTCLLTTVLLCMNTEIKRHNYYKCI